MQGCTEKDRKRIALQIQILFAPFWFRQMPVCPNHAQICNRNGVRTETLRGIRATNYLKLAHPTQRQSRAKPKKRLRKH
jgi:hypothetical protein